MQAEPLKKAIYAKAKELGVTRIELSFSGGSDEGCLYVHAEGPLQSTDASEEGNALRIGIGKLESDVDDWAWEVYSYSGAGDGSDYGDNIVYDLKAGTVSTQEWAMQQHVAEEMYDTLETL